jgi:hypothetical protein
LRVCWRNFAERTEENFTGGLSSFLGILQRPLLRSEGAAIKDNAKVTEAAVQLTHRLTPGLFLSHFGSLVWYRVVQLFWKCIARFYSGI